MKASKSRWTIHGKVYDLTAFLPLHPGGARILELARDDGLDSTPLFECYHAFANRDAIADIMKKYEIPDESPPMGKGSGMYSYEDDGFYRTLVRRARAHFGADSSRESVTHRIKATKFWYARAMFTFAIYALSFYYAFVRHRRRDDAMDDPTLTVAVAGFTAGTFLICWGFSVMHDASHFAVSASTHGMMRGRRGVDLNSLFMNSWISAALWNSSSFWMLHHVVRHHAFTGHPSFDPDVVHAKPFIRKSSETKSRSYFRFTFRGGEDDEAIPLQTWWFLASYAAIIYLGMPGFYLGQVMAYNLIWTLKGSLWRMSRPTALSPSASLWSAIPALIFQLGISSAVVYLQFSSRCWFVGVPSYVSMLLRLRSNADANDADLDVKILGANFSYAMAIIPDHDTFESANLFHVSLPQSPSSEHDAKPKDFGEVQVRHSADFCVPMAPPNTRGSSLSQRLLNWTFTNLYGGINLQIEHHLFPSVNSDRLLELVPLVRATCEEFGVPYVQHVSLGEAMRSFIRTIHECMVVRVHRV